MNDDDRKYRTNQRALAKKQRTANSLTPAGNFLSCPYFQNIRIRNDQKADMSRKIFTTLLLFISLCACAQNPTPSGFFYPSPVNDSRRVSGVVITEGIAFTGAMVALQYLWYRSYPHSRFHFFNDNSEWLQMDKMGHAATAYNLGVLGTDVYRWTGMPQDKAIWCGGITGLIFLTTIEIFDGFSSGWGFSGGDMLANSAGAGLVIGQYLGWHEQRVMLKFSYHKTIYPSYRPDELGTSPAQSILKDYNGQSYWLSFNIASFLDHTSSFPKWLNLAVGLGADGMISGRKNQDASAANNQPLPSFERSRRLFLSPDADFRRIETGCQASLIFFKTIDFLKVPAPALEYRSSLKKFRLHPLYF